MDENIFTTDYKTYLVYCLFKDFEENFEYGILTQKQFENRLTNKNNFGEIEWMIY